MASADLIVTRPVQTARGVDAPVVLQRGRTVPGHHAGHDGLVTFRVASVGCGQRGQSLIGAVLRRHAGKVSHSPDPRQLDADGAFRPAGPPPASVIMSALHVQHSVTRIGRGQAMKSDGYITIARARQPATTLSDALEQPRR